MSSISPQGYSNPAANEQSTIGAYTLPQVARLYNFPTSVDGSGQCIAIIALGGGYKIEDLQAYFQQLGISMPQVTAVPVDGGRNSPDSGPNQVVFDIEVVGAIAPGAHIVVYFASNSDRGYLDAINAATSDTINKPSVILCNWGAPESNWTNDAMQAINQALQEAAERGITVCCAVGDQGSGGGLNDGKAHVVFPASSPYVLSCGGTRLEATNNQVISEVVWNKLTRNGGATGGGVSDVFSLPSWQANAQVPPSINDQHAGRGVPDVAGNADPETGYMAYFDGQNAVVGGTTAAAGLWAGLIALINQQRGRPLGYLNPILYQNYQQLVQKSALRDVISGSNGAYTAGTGWDACTGLGTPDGARLLAALTEELPGPSLTEIAIRALADKPSEVDLLKFTDYTKALVDFIENENTVKPLTIVIDAPWGMGKSTLMGLIMSELKDRAKTHKRRPFPTVWFNAWKYDQESSLWAALALEILVQVRKQFNIWQQLRFWFKLNMKRLDRNILIHALLKALPFILGLILLGGILFLITWLWLGSAFLDTLKKSIASIGILAGITAAFAFGKEIYSKIIKPLDQQIARYVRAPDYKERIGFLAEFEEDFKLVIEAVTENGKWPLVIFIDDLDRCAPPKPVEIIEAINILLDAKHCVFVIGMDAQTVAGSIEAKYKDLQDYLKDIDDPGGLTLGERFLEKIVQINFHIPRSDSDVMKEFILESLKAKPGAEKGGPTVNPPGEEVTETAELIKAEQRTGKPLDAAAQAVQKTRPDIKVELVEQAKQEVFAKTFDDSEEVKRAIQEAALYLGFNPRKIKRFINAFRLQALIANRRRLIETGTIQLDLLAKWITIVTRWPDLIEAMLIDQNFLKSLKEACLASEELSQSNGRFLASAKGKKLQVIYDRYLANPHLKRLIEARDLLNLLKQMPENEIEALPQYLYLTRTTINARNIEEKPPN